MSLNPPGPPTTRRELREQEARRAKAPAFAAPPPEVRTVVVRRPVAKKKTTSPLLSFGALLFAGALLVGVSVPANAFKTDAAQVSAKTETVEGQSVAVSDVAVAADATRGDYTVTSYAEMLRQRYGNRSYSYTVGTGVIQWPFPYAVPISGGFGERVAPCRGCSTFHTGTDFVPGAGTPIYAVAAGVVISSIVGNTGFGNNVLIDHEVDGAKFQSFYGHMQMNSSPLHAGDVVQVGDFVGLVGQTGVATGPHLHLEIHVNGVPVDAFVWLKAHAAK